MDVIWCDSQACGALLVCEMGRGGEHVVELMYGVSYKMGFFLTVLLLLSCLPVCSPVETFRLRDAAFSHSWGMWLTKMCGLIISSDFIIVVVGKAWFVVV